MLVPVAMTSAPSSDNLSALGPLRSIHAPAALLRTLSPALVMIVFFIVLASVLVSDMGPVVFAVVFPFALATFALLAWSPIQMRHLRVALHAHGVVVSTLSTRSIIVFDDVDEVWMDLDPTRTPFGSITWLRALRVVERDGKSHRIPTNIQGGGEIAQWVVRNCSNPLLAEALRTLREGQPLTFGRINLDREGIRGPSWATRWSELSLVRAVPGKISLFRGQRIIPWRSIRLDHVPHPTIFAEIVRECAPKADASPGSRRKS